MKKICLLTIIIFSFVATNVYALSIHREKSVTYEKETDKSNSKKHTDENSKNIPVLPIINTNINMENIPLFVPGASFSLPMK